MAQFQLLSCTIALAGDILNVVARHAHAPITYPEFLVLRFMHGETAVNDVFDVGHVERDEDSEMKRLVETYGNQVVREKMFPGAGTRLPLGDNRYRPRLDLTTSGPVAPVPNVPDLPLPDATASMAEGTVPENVPVTGDTYAGVPVPDYAHVPVPPAPPTTAPAARRPTPVAG